MNKNYIKSIFLQISLGLIPGLSYSEPDNGKAVSNPGMGWVIYFYANSLKYYADNINTLSDKELQSFPGLAVVTFRLNWSDLEPEEGKFNWEIIDKPAERFFRLGLKISIRVSNSENSADKPYATPKWVFDSGAEGVRFRPGYPGIRDINGANHEPKFDDPIFLEKLERFVKRLSERYDEPQRVDFVDIGSFGVYGEGHTFSSTKTPYSRAVIDKHIAIYKKYFKKTRLVLNHNFADHLQNGQRDFDLIYGYSESGMAIRDDSLLIDKDERAFYDEEMGQRFMPFAPVILETGEYSTRIKKGFWNKGKIIEAIKKYGASYIGAYWYPAEYLKANYDLVGDVNKIIGYRFNINNVSYDRKVAQGNSVKVRYTLENVGYARAMFEGYPKIIISKTDGHIMGSQIDGAVNVKNIFRGGGSSVKSEVDIKFKKPLQIGSYFIGFELRSKSGIYVNLPYDDFIPNTTFYKIGEFLVSKDER